MINEPIRTFKDTVFRMLFRDKERLLELYNGVNGTCYDDQDELEIITLENAIYMNVKNDISCVLDFRMNLYEHQSTVNPNMPLRDLFYVARLYERVIMDRDIYSRKRISLPTPRFFVFYNGIEEQPERKVMRLSDSFEIKGEEVCLELIVTQININQGYNGELMMNCRTLYEYMCYVERVRRYEKILPLKEAVERAVDECIEENILADFLKQNRAEVVQMSIFEYDEELHKRTLLEEGIEQGIAGAVAIMRDMNISEKEIADRIKKQYRLTDEKIGKLFS